MCVIVLLESFTFADKDEYEYKILSKYYVYVRASIILAQKNAIAVVILRLILVARTSYQM